MGKFVVVAEIHFDQAEGEDIGRKETKVFVAQAPDEKAVKKVVEAYVYGTLAGVNWVYVYDTRDITDALHINISATGKAI